MRAQHPEATADEVHIGNVYSADFARVGWTSKRLGKWAIGSDGKGLKGGSMRPVFVSRVEIEAAGVPVPNVGPVGHRW